MAQELIDFIEVVFIVGACLGLAIIAIRRFPLVPAELKGIAEGCAWVGACVLLLYLLLPMIGLHL